MFGFSGKKFFEDAEGFLIKNGSVIAEKLNQTSKETIEKIKETVFPELKGWAKTEIKDGKYSYIIVMAGIKKEKAKVKLINGNLFVTGWNSENEIIVDFKQTVGKDEVSSAKLEDGMMTVILTVGPENKDINID